MVAPIDPRDLWGPSGPYYKGKIGNKPVSDAASPQQGETKGVTGNNLEKLLEKIQAKLTGKPAPSPHVIHVSSLQEALEKLAELVGYQPSQKIQDSSDKVDLAQQALLQAMREAGFDESVTCQPPEIVDTQLITAAMNGVGKLTALASLGGRGLSALRWILQRAVVSDPEDKSGQPWDYHRLVTKAKQKLRQYCDEHRELLGTRSGRFAYAATELCSDGKPLTVMEAAVLFVAAYELERKIDSKVNEHPDKDKSQEDQTRDGNDQQSKPDTGYQG